MNPDCAGRDRPHGRHQLAGPGGNKPGARCDGSEEPLVAIIDEADYFERTGKLFPPGITREADVPTDWAGDSPDWTTS